MYSWNDGFCSENIFFHFIFNATGPEMLLVGHMNDWYVSPIAFCSFVLLLHLIIFNLCIWLAGTRDAVSMKMNWRYISNIMTETLVMLNAVYAVDFDVNKHHSNSWRFHISVFEWHELTADTIRFLIHNFIVFSIFPSIIFICFFYWQFFLLLFCFLLQHYSFHCFFCSCFYDSVVDSCQ